MRRHRRGQPSPSACVATLADVRKGETMARGSACIVKRRFGDDERVYSRPMPARVKREKTGQNALLQTLALRIAIVPQWLLKTA